MKSLEYKIRMFSCSTDKKWEHIEEGNDTTSETYELLKRTVLEMLGTTNLMILCGIGTS